VLTLSFIVSQDTVQHVNSSVSETSVECTEADWLFEYVDSYTLPQI